MTWREQLEGLAGSMIVIGGWGGLGMMNFICEEEAGTQCIAPISAVSLLDFPARNPSTTLANTTDNMSIDHGIIIKYEVMNPRPHFPFLFEDIKTPVPHCVTLFYMVF